jgi:hypothetical protein
MDADQPAKKRGLYKKTIEKISSWPTTRPFDGACHLGI